MSDPLPFTLPASLLYRIQLRSDLPSKHYFTQNKRKKLELPIVLVNEFGLSRKSDFRDWYAEEREKVWLVARLVFPVTEYRDERVLEMKEAGRTVLGADGRGHVCVELVDHALDTNDRGGSYSRTFYVEIRAFDSLGKERDDIVSLVLGEFQLPSSQQPATEDEEEEPVSVFRAIPLPPGTPAPFFSPSTSHPNQPTSQQHLLLIREEWGSGIPSKAWDSAIILSRLLLSPSFCFPKGTILDLSSGNALLGVLVWYLIGKQGGEGGREVVVTELEEALGLLQSNVSLNSSPQQKQQRSGIKVCALNWLHPHLSSLSKHSISLCLASDLLYEPEYFPALLGTLDYLIALNGEILLGYKRRGLTKEEEGVFWNGLKELGFVQVEVEVGMSELGDKIGVAVYRFRRTRVGGECLIREWE